MKKNKHTIQGGIRFGFLLIVCMAAMLWGGGQGLYTAITNRQPTVLSYGEYLRAKPKATWLQLRDCSLYLPETAVLKRFGRIEELFIPVRSLEPNGPKEIHVVLATKDPELLSFIREMSENKSTAQAASFLLKHIDQLTMKRDIRGMVRFGIDLKEKDREKLVSLNGKLAKDFTILDDGREPEVASSLVLFGLGLTIPVWMAYSIRRNGQKAQPAKVP